MSVAVALWQHLPVAAKNEGFSDRVKALLKARGMTQKDLAKDTGILAPTLSRWLSGGRRPPADEMTKIAAALGVTTDWLWSGTGPKLASKSAADPMITQLEAWARGNMPANGVTEEVLAAFVTAHVHGGGIDQTLDDLYADLLTAARAAKRGRFRVVTDEEAQVRQTLAAGGASEEEIEEELAARAEKPR